MRKGVEEVKVQCSHLGGSLPAPLPPRDKPQIIDLTENGRPNFEADVEEKNQSGNHIEVPLFLPLADNDQHPQPSACSPEEKE